MKRSKLITAWAVVDKAGHIQWDFHGRAYVYFYRRDAEDRAAGMNPECAVRVRRIPGKLGKLKGRGKR